VEGDYWFNHQKYGGAKEVQVPGVLIGFLLGLGADYGLCVAIRLGDEVRVRALLDSDPALANQLSNDPSGPSTAGDHGRRRPIVEAAKYGRLEIARVLIKAGADVNLGVPLWSPNGHALFEACARGEVAMARLLLQAGARANVEVESSGDCFSIMKRNEPDIVGALQALLTEYGGIAVNYDE
jgi:ankyrin repeat protein